MLQSSPRSYSIIIPVFNKWELTRACLSSLRDHTPGNSFEVIVVDNASSDATPAELPGFGQELFGENFHYIRNAENKNFAGASNQGAKEARTDILFFLNNDTLLTPDWDTPLLNALENDHSLGAVGPMLIYLNDKIQHLGAAIYPDNSIQHFYLNIPATHPLALKRRSLNFITGAALMVNKKNFFAAGAFCEEYINGFEDVEFCCRLRQIGLMLTVEPASKIYHLESQSPGRHDREDHNAILFHTRCPGPHRPDFHRVVLDDGYIPYLDRCFETFVTLPQTRLQELEEKSDGSTDATLYWNLLSRELFWEAGYKKLAQIFTMNGQLEWALDTMGMCCRFFPSLENLKLLVSLARQTGNMEVTTSLMKSIEVRVKMMNDKKMLLKSYEQIMNMAQADGDSHLLSMVKAWRKLYGKEFLA